MKLKNIFTALVAVLALFTSCVKEQEMFLSEVSVSSSYIGLPAEGGSKTISLTATDKWTINVSEAVAEWLTVTPVSGDAGTVDVTFKAGAATSTQSATLKLNCAGKTQLINVLQQTVKVELPVSSSSVVNAAEDGGIWRVRGVVRGIENTTYGNYYIDDEEGSVYVYGTLYNGEEKQFSKLGIEAGDVIVVEGKRGSYKGAPQLVNVEVISIEKSLIKVESTDPEDALIPIEGGEVAVSLMVKGDGVSTVIPEDAKSWLSVAGISVSGNSAVVTLSAAANESGDRQTTVTFVTTKGGKQYTSITTVSQKGAIIETTADKINAATDGATLYRLTGYITRDTGNDYGNIYIKDATGEVYCYGVLNDNGEAKKWKEMGISEGDIVTVVGPKASHNGNPQLKNVSVENHIKVSDISIAAFSKLEDDKNTWYRISGKVGKSNEAGTKYDLTTYGNFALFDGADEIYVYGVKAGWGGAKGEFGKLGVKEGDNLTIVCYKTSYNGLNEADGCFYVSHEAGQAENPDDEANVTIDFTAQGYENATEVTTLTVDGITLTFDKGTNSNSPKFYTTGTAVRLYGGNTLTVSGKTVTKIVFTYSAGEGTNEITADNGTFDTDTWTGESSSVIFTVGGTSGHRRIAKIAISVK